MLMRLILLLGLLSVPLAGGSYQRLASLRIAARPAILAAIGLQVVIISLLPDGLPWLHRLGYLMSYALAAWFLWANRRITGVPVIAIGGALNLLAIVANGGVMPASRAALERAGLASAGDGFLNSAAVAHPHLAVLGDIFAPPAGTPLSTAFSVGDALLIVGALVALHAAAGSRPGRRRRGARLATQG